MVMLSSELKTRYKSVTYRLKYFQNKKTNKKSIWLCCSSVALVSLLFFRFEIGKPTHFIHLIGLSRVCYVCVSSPSSLWFDTPWLELYIYRPIMPKIKKNAFLKTLKSSRSLYFDMCGLGTCVSSQFAVRTFETLVRIWVWFITYRWSVHSSMFNNNFSFDLTFTR